jgi:hypothetical protein
LQYYIILSKCNYLFVLFLTCFHIFFLYCFIFIFSHMCIKIRDIIKTQVYLKLLYGCSWWNFRGCILARVCDYAIVFYGSVTWLLKCFGVCIYRAWGRVERTPMISWSHDPHWGIVGVILTPPPLNRHYHTCFSCDVDRGKVIVGHMGSHAYAGVANWA